MSERSAGNDNGNCNCNCNCNCRCAGNDNGDSSRHGVSRAGEIRSSGLSVIDSLFSDENTRVLHAYMLTILGASLSDAARCAVLRLDYPDRLRHAKMNFAHETYNDTVGNNALPEAAKQDLRKDVCTLVDRSCLLM